MPGTIHEGGELGYALATAFGAAMDNPDLIVACIVGDGEAETGPTAGSWHGTKFLDPATCGAVLPILAPQRLQDQLGHDLRDDERRRADRPLHWLRLGACIVDVGRATIRRRADGRGARSRPTELIGAIQRQARAGADGDEAAWPMIVLRTPKGWTGPKEIDGKPVEGTFRAHQVPAEDLKTNPAHLAILEAWLRSYKPEELFDVDGGPGPDILGTCPRATSALGMSPHTRSAGGCGGRWTCPTRRRGRAGRASGRDGRERTGAASVPTCARSCERTEDDRNFRIVCPDELESNKLGAVLEATGRAYAWPVEARRARLRAGRPRRWRSSPSTSARAGSGLPPDRPARAVPVLRGVRPRSSTRMIEAVRQVAEDVRRDPVAAARSRRSTYLLTSDAWRQDHNGYSHQGPGFINTPAHQEGHGRAHLPAAGCEHASSRPSTTACAPPATSTWSSPPSSRCRSGCRWTRRTRTCRRGRLDLALGVDRRGRSTRTSSSPRPATMPTNEVLAAASSCARRCRSCACASST